MLKYDIVVLGSGESGVGAAILAKSKGFNVFVSDSSHLKNDIKNILDNYKIPWEEKNHSTDIICQAKIVVKSPGISRDTDLLKTIKNKGITVISEIEFASQYSKAFILGITGSNGKTTTSSLIYNILKFAKKDVALAGNIGDSFSKTVFLDDPSYCVLEVSSFQLDDCIDFYPKIATITNITPDHLERYNYQMDKYTDSKFRIVKNHSKKDYLIYDADNLEIVNYIKTHDVKSSLVPFSLTQTLEYGIFFKQNNIMVNMKNIYNISRDKVALKGRHNLKNAMAATAMAELLKVDKETIKAGLANFESVPHRLQKVASLNHTTFINDSKATNINAVFYALESVNGSCIWIVGGVDKGNDYIELLPLVREKVKAIICIGVDNKKIIDSYRDVVNYLVEASSMSQAVSTAYNISEKGDTVLLSPACASFDRFKDYQDRGNQFLDAVKQLES